MIQTSYDAAVWHLVVRLVIDTPQMTSEGRHKRHGGELVEMVSIRGLGVFGVPVNRASQQVSQLVVFGAHLGNIIPAVVVIGVLRHGLIRGQLPALRLFLQFLVSFPLTPLLPVFHKELLPQRGIGFPVSCCICCIVGSQGQVFGMAFVEPLMFRLLVKWDCLQHLDMASGRQLRSITGDVGNLVFPLLKAAHKATTTAAADRARFLWEGSVSGAPVALLEGSLLQRGYRNLPVPAIP